jgi:phosphatidylglycerophosphate synthase
VLAGCFPLVVDRPGVALGLLMTAALTDVLDGWIARRYGMATATGAALDPVTDKLFVLTVAITLIVTGRISLGAVLLLSTRELGELPLVVWFVLNPRARAAHGDYPQANPAGKAATVLQFATIGWLLVRFPGVALWIAVTALAGVFAAASYWRRALHPSAHSAEHSAR